MITDTDLHFSETIADLHNYVNPENGKKAPLIADDVYEIVMKNDAVSLCDTCSTFWKISYFVVNGGI